MSASDSEIQWFIARDGKQHGPLSEPEIRKLVELNHLRATDLIWRLGFPDWRPALSVFPPPAAEPVSAIPSQTPTPRPEHPEEAVRYPATPAAASPNLYAQPQPYAVPHDLRPDHPASRPLGTPFRGGNSMEPAITAGPGPGGPRPQQFAAPVDEPEPEQRRRGGGVRRAFLLLILLGIVGGGGWYGYKHKDLVIALVRSFTTASAKSVPVVVAPEGAAKTPSGETQSAAVAAAAVAPATTSASIGPEFLKRPLWTTVKQEFPEWYDARVAEASHLTAEGKPDDEIIRHLVQGLVTLRRENSQAALAASAAKHRELATAFLNNLKQLAGESSDGCYDFISKGETSPFIVSRMGDADKSANIDTQVITIISAISEGKKTPVTHASPVKADYDVLASELTRLGWTQADMQLFADPKALARAPRDRICKMLQDWFSAHLAISDPAVQERLLFETLKPVISG